MKRREFVPITRTSYTWSSCQTAIANGQTRPDCQTGKVHIKWVTGNRRNPVDCRRHLDRAETRILAYPALTG